MKALLPPSVSAVLFAMPAGLLAADSAAVSSVYVRVDPGTVKECRATPCEVDVPVKATSGNFPCAVVGMTETVNVWAPMNVKWKIKKDSGDYHFYRFSAGKGVRFVKPKEADPLPDETEFADPDYDEQVGGDYINPRTYRWTSAYGGRKNLEFHYELNLKMLVGGSWKACDPADPKIVNKE